MPQPRPSNRKPPIPWPRIQARYESDPSATGYSLSREFSPDADHPRPTRQAIEYRIRTYGWRKKQSLIDLASGAKNVQSPGRTVPLKHRDPTILALAAQTYAVTGHYGRTAQAVGIHRDTLRNWLKADPKFRQAMDMARAQQLLALESSIHDSGRVDWKAAAYVLERAQETRQRYSKGQGKGEGVSFVLAIPRAVQGGSE